MNVNGLHKLNYIQITTQKVSKSMVEPVAIFQLLEFKLLHLLQTIKKQIKVLTINFLKGKLQITPLKFGVDLILHPKVSET